MKARGLSIGVFALCVATGCDEAVVVSTDVSTLDMTLSLDATDQGQGTTVRVRVSSPLGRLRLSGGDTLRASMAGKNLDLREVEEDGLPLYLADVEGLSDDIILDLERPADRSLVGRVVPVPPPIGLSAEPLVGDFPLVLAWNAAPEGNHTLGLAVGGTCIHPLSRTLPNDVGKYEIFQAELAPVDLAAPAKCPLQVTLARTATLQEPIAEPATQIGLYAWFVLSRTVEVSWGP